MKAVEVLSGIAISLLCSQRTYFLLPAAPPEATFQLSDEVASELQNKIKHLLSEDKVYHNPNYTLKDLSQKLNTQERAVSYVVNRYLAANFYDLINDYRIDEAKEILKNNKDPKLTILEVLFSVGFNSKSSFNTQFKKKTGLTPSEFKSLHKN